MNVSGNRKTKGAHIQLWDNPSCQATQWRLTATGTHNVYTVENINAKGQYLNIRRNEINCGAVIQLWDNPGSPATQWRITCSSAGVFTMESMHAKGKYMNVLGNGVRKGSSIQLWNNPDSPATQWRIASVDNEHSQDRSLDLGTSFLSSALVQEAAACHGLVEEESACKLCLCTSWTF